MNMSSSGTAGPMAMVQAPNINKQVDVLEKLYNKKKYSQVIDEGWKIVRSWNRKVERIQATADLWKFMGLAYFQLKDFNGARACFGNAIVTIPEDSEAMIGRGMAYFAMNKMEEAEKDLEAALKIKSDDAKALILMAAVYAVKKETKKASEFAKKAASKDPKLAIDVCTSMIDAYYDNMRCTNTERMQLMKMKKDLKEEMKRLIKEAKESLKSEKLNKK
ncbi:MAG: tetratricopeptide repeat protein [Candidatus Micrarchaeia archaeon]